jgi:hypothetical protein
MSSQPGTPEPRPIALLSILLVVGLMAVACGILLMINGLWMPLSVLATSPFDSFLMPGLVLSVVVGGSLLGSAWLIWRRHRLAPLVSAAAGAILLGWVVVESVLVHDGRPLQGAILVCALAVLTLSWRFWRRAPAPP